MFSKHLVSENAFEKVRWARPLTRHLSQGMLGSTEERTENFSNPELSLSESHPIQMMEIHHGL